jgi:hypothetical protein
MGSRGSLVVEEEQRAMLFGEKDPNLKEPGDPRSMVMAVTNTAAGKPVLDSSSTTGGVGEKTVIAGAGSADSAGPISRGYREEMEHFAYCVRMHQQAKSPDEKRQWRLAPRCHGKVAMADAIIALTSNQAMKRQQRIVFDEKWFDPASTEVPDADMKPHNAKEELV